MGTGTRTQEYSWGHGRTWTAPRDAGICVGTLKWGDKRDTCWDTGMRG